MPKTALITGSGRGIGRATALLAADHGYDVCINYSRDETSATQVADQCNAKGVKAICVQAHVGERKEVIRLFKTCDENLGKPDLLVNNAGIIGQATPLVDLTEAALKATYNTNVFGSVYCAQEAIKRMARSTGGNGGVIINISSIAAILGSPFEYVHYASSKAAIEALTVGLAKEVGHEGIRVNAVRAGTTDTEIHARSGNPDRPAQVAKASPLGRIASVDDIAEAVIWLASEKAGFTSGSILSIAGGL